MSDLDNAILAINQSADKTTNTATFLDDLGTFDKDSNVTNPNNGQTVPSIAKRIDEIIGDQIDEINETAAQVAEDAQEIADAADLFEEQREQFDATFTAQFQYARIGNISDFVGDTLTDTEKLNSYQYPDDSDNWYGPIQSQTFPITIPADPTFSGSGWALVNGLTSDSLSLYTGIVYKTSGGNSAVENMVAGIPIQAKNGDTCNAEGSFFICNRNNPSSTSDFTAINKPKINTGSPTGYLDFLIDNFGNAEFGSGVFNQDGFTAEYRFNISGMGGENSQVILNGGITYDTNVTLKDDHTTKNISDIWFRGSTASADALVHIKRGSFAKHLRNTYSGEDGASTLFKITGSFVSSGEYNHYRSGSIGCHLSGTTVYSEIGSYYRGNSTYALYVEGAATENINLQSCAIEGNRGSAVYVSDNVNDLASLRMESTYLELNGDFDAGINAVFVSSNASLTTLNQCKLSYNILPGWTNGNYIWGDLLKMEGCRVAGFHNVNELSSENNIYADCIFNSESFPSDLIENGGSVFNSGIDAFRGYLFNTPMNPVRAPSFLNSSLSGHPYLSPTGGTNPPTITAQSNSLGLGDSSKVAFTDNEIYAPGNNSALWNSTESGNVQPNGRYKVLSFFLNANQTAKLRFISTGGGQNADATHKFLAGKWYKVIVIMGRDVPSTRLQFGPSEAYTGLSVQIIDNAQRGFDTQREQTQFITTM